jgi:uncharacterized membrane protein YbhN (UPF0104 family)
MKNIKNIIFKFIGYGITLVSFFYIFFLLKNIELAKLQGALKAFFLLKYCIFTIICTLSNFILAFAWRSILEFLHKKSLPFGEILKIYMKTFIARYIPGNIFHFVGRQLLGNKLGINHAVLALSSILESFMLLIVGSIFILTGFFQNFFNISILDRIDINNKKLLLLVAGGCFIAVIYFIYKNRLKEIFGSFSIRRMGFWVKMCLFYSLFLFINGVILFCIFSFMLKTDLKIDNLPIIICAQVFAWMGGFITPGAPGGLGIREALLAITLSNILPVTIIVAGALIFRIITLFGEVLALCIAMIFFTSPFEKNLQNTDT